MRCPTPLAPGAVDPAAALPAAELAARLDRLLSVAGRLVARIPDGAAALRDLGFHLFRIALAFCDGMDTGRVRPEWLRETAPVDLRDGSAVARYGALVQGRLGGWFEGAGAGEYRRVVDAAGEPQSGRVLLAVTARHVAYHVRQLHAELAEQGEPAEGPAPDDLDGLGLAADA